MHNVVRFAGNGGSETWQFWLDVPSAAGAGAGVLLFRLRHLLLLTSLTGR